MIDPKKMLDDFEAQDRYIVSLQSENERLRNDIALRDAAIRALEEKRVELNVEIGERDDQITALQSKVHLCAGLREALFGSNGALTRMDRARAILLKGDGNWAMLDTTDIRRVLTTEKDTR